LVYPLTTCKILSCFESYLILSTVPHSVPTIQFHTRSLIHITFRIYTTKSISSYWGLLTYICRQVKQLDVAQVVYKYILPQCCTRSLYTFRLSSVFLLSEVQLF
jgi:hypothetical protein